MARNRPAKRRAARPAARRPGSCVTLRTPGGAAVVLDFHRDALHRLTVPWNTWLVAARLQDEIPKTERRDRAGKLLADVARAGGISATILRTFLRRAATEGIVQVETDWTGHAGAETTRLFPWEETLALAARDDGGTRPRRRLVVVRWLRRTPRRPAPASGPAAILVTSDAGESPFGTDSEYRVVRRPLTATEVGAPPRLEVVDSPAAIRRCLRARGGEPPGVVHWMLRSVDRGIVFDAGDRALSLGEDPPPGARHPRDLPSDRHVAEAIAAHHPAVVALSSCYTGRRLAPLVVAAGADLAIGFHQEVADSSLPGFFASWYTAWRGGTEPIESLREAIAFNHDQPDHEDLGAITLWSARDLLDRSRSGAGRSRPLPVTPTPGAEVAPSSDGLVFDCEPEPALNYSVLHCSRGGIFRRFVVTALEAPPPTPLDVVVTLDTGNGAPSECRASTPAPDRRHARIDLAALVALPLGGASMRERRETLKGTVTVTVGSAGQTLFERTFPIDLLPCDEWHDDEYGSRFLPAFVLPRDPAVRTVIGRSQGFLRAIIDGACGSFTGYPETPPRPIESPFEAQLRAMWYALVDGFRLDYVVPPPTYFRRAQRLRTPEEVLRGNRGTCIELALLLASCWEHIGFHPVLFLTTGHAFCGVWNSAGARERFFAGLRDPLLTGGFPDRHGILGGTLVDRSAAAPWMLTEPVQHAAILRAVDDGFLVPVEASHMAYRSGLAEAIAAAKGKLHDAIGGIRDARLDAMLDVRTARERGVTPLPILTDGPVA